jgi:biotin carboxyl carrier protein
MESTITALRAGTVITIAAWSGARVEQGDLILELDKPAVSREPGASRRAA